MKPPGWKPGEWVIYRKQKRSTSPGPRAEEVHPAPAGETYSYVVEKYWIVQQVLGDGRLQMLTRRGKTHVVAPDDPRLKRPRWWERWLFKARFRAVEDSTANERSRSV
ncbi:MAG: hypothetical protein KF861_23785 [Planctomycetaceae bacterium]|nr:hypothetical protein [Planctomycetaceae bacterium]